MHIEIVSPEATLFTGEANSVTLPGVDGSFQILNNHAPIVAVLQSGQVKIAAPSFALSKEAESKVTKLDAQTLGLQINSGTIEMNNNKVIILVD